MNKLDTVNPAQRGSLAADGALHGALIVEGIQPGPYDPERAQAVLAAIRARTAAIREGDLSGVEQDLTAQAAWLAALVERLLAKAEAAGNPNAAAIWYGLALRAAGVHVRTSGALAGLVLSQQRAERLVPPDTDTE